MNSNGLEKILWSIALPGFGQLLNGKFLKGLLLIGLELSINIQTNLNELIILSFHGDISKIIGETNYQWIMFYPCIYMFAIYDAYKDARSGNSPYTFVPFVFGAYFGTIGVIFSSSLLGAVWTGLAGICLGTGIGFLIRKFVMMPTQDPND